MSEYIILDSRDKEELESKITSLNIQNGIAEGSLRSVGAAIEDAEYSLGENAVALGSSNKASGTSSYAEGGHTTAKGSCSHAEGNQTQANGHYSHSEGQQTVANAHYSHAEGAYTTAYGEWSHAEGNSTITSGECSHAEGSITKAKGDYSHAEGRRVNAYGLASHAENGVKDTYKLVVSGEANATSYTTTDTTQYYEVGRKFLYGTDTIVTVTNVSGQTITFDKTLSSEALVDAEITYIYGAYGDYSHSEGYGTVTDDHSAHAEGYATSANIKYSHAEGQCTVANAPAQHAQGRFNIIDTEGKYAHIVGNGTSDTQTRSNAHTLDWNGNAWFMGDVYVGGESQVDTDAKLLATQEWVNSAITAALGGSIVGMVDENNNIILTGDLENGLYSLKYEDNNGNTTNIGTINIGNVAVYTNVLPLSTNVNGNPYNGGLGYKSGYRYSQSGGGDVTGNGLFVTGYIKCKDTDTLYFKNVGMNKNAGINNGCNAYLFNSLSATSTSMSDASTITTYLNGVWDADGNIVSMKANNTNTGKDMWLRFNTTYLGNDSIITINQPIG